MSRDGEGRNRESLAKLHGEWGGARTPGVRVRERERERERRVVDRGSRGMGSVGKPWGGTTGDDSVLPVAQSAPRHAITRALLSFLASRTRAEFPSFFSRVRGRFFFLLSFLFFPFLFPNRSLRFLAAAVRRDRHYRRSLRVERRRTFSKVSMIADNIASTRSRSRMATLRRRYRGSRVFARRSVLSRRSSDERQETFQLSRYFLARYGRAPRSSAIRRSRNVASN